MKKLNCAPNTEDTRIGGFTCFNDTKIMKIRDSWNLRHSDKQIHSNSPRVIWKQLKNYLHTVCDSEKCWLRQEFMEHNLDDDLLHYTFAPTKPKEWAKNPTEWLSTLDIHNVMEQWEQKYKDFEFLGASPINYDTIVENNKCVWEDICRFNLKEQMKHGKCRFGIVFNLDPHYKEGSHWVSMFIDVKKRTINYFDSYGFTPEPEIEKFIYTVLKQGESIHIPFKVNINKKRHQFSESECGMYSLYFIIKLLKGYPFNDFQKKLVKDSTMIRLRNKYFNNY